MTNRQVPSNPSPRKAASSPLPEKASKGEEPEWRKDFDIDAYDAAPWVGLHYRHEFLLHPRHELLEFPVEENPPAKRGRKGEHG